MRRPVLLIAAIAAALPSVAAHAQRADRSRAAVVVPAAMPVLPAPTPAAPLVTAVTLADLGFAAGLRFSNLGGRQEIFVPLPSGADLAASELLLSLDDVSAHEARRSVEILINDRSAAAIALDGKSMGRQVRVPLARVRGRAGFAKLTFVYSGAATQDRCIDVRYIGDSLTIRPESAIEIDVGSRSLDVATTAALMPRDVAVVLSSRKLGSADLAGALTVGRSLRASGRRVSFHHGFEQVAELARRDDPRRWSRGLILIGEMADVAEFAEPQPVRVATAGAQGTLAAVSAAGLPALVIADSDTVRAARLLTGALLPAIRGVSAATVGDAEGRKAAPTRLTFEDMALAPAIAEVFGRADVTFAIATRNLPANTRASRLALDVMVAPDGSGERAVVSVFVNERLLNSAVAAVGEPTRFDLALPDGLTGAAINARVLVQRRSAQGDCRFEPQGYPAQVLGSSAVVLTDARDTPGDFSDLSAWWANGVEVWLPSPAGQRPAPLLALVFDTLAALSPDAAPIAVRFRDGDGIASPTAPFIAIGHRAPAGSKPRVHFDRGRVTVNDRSDRTLLDLGGFIGGAALQIVSAGAHPGLWIKPFAADGSLPSPPELRIDRGDIAFVDQSGVALAMSSERDTLIRVAYPEQVSWLTIADRFRPWIVGAVWALVTVTFLFGLQRMLHRRGVKLGG